MTPDPPDGRRTGARRPLPVARDYLVMTAGVVCIALSVDIFLGPNDVVAGGVTGVAMLLRSVAGTPVGLMVLAMNVPLFLLGFRHLGGAAFGARTLYATVALALAIDALAPLGRRFLIRDPILFTVYGGLLDGVGLGLVFRARGTTGGIDIVARLLERLRGARLGQTLLALDVGIFAMAGLIHGATPALYALLVAFVSSRVVNVVQEGVGYARAAVIVTPRPEAIRAAVLEELARGVTLLEGRGGYTSEGRPVLLCVVARTEEGALKDLIARVDPAAFVVILEAAEVLGEGFSPFRRR